MADKGVVVARQEPRTARLLLESCFAPLGSERWAAVEATGSGCGLADLLRDSGVEPQLAHAKRLEAITAAEVKTGSVDSHTPLSLFVPT